MSVLPTFKAPKFTLTLPVSGLELKARPFLIREQKVLLQAIEVGDKDQVINTLDDIMQECTFSEVSTDSLPVPDVEYLMLHLRSKSVGEQIKLSYTCNKITPNENDGESPCNTRIPVTIPISDIKVDIDPKRKSKLIFDGGIGIQLKDNAYADPDIINYAKNHNNKSILIISNDLDVKLRADKFINSDRSNAVLGKDIIRLI